MYQYPHVSQLFILTSLAKPGIPGAIKSGCVCTADYRMLLGTAVRPVPARMPCISRLCDVGARTLNADDDDDEGGHRSFYQNKAMHKYQTRLSPHNAHMNRPYATLH